MILKIQGSKPQCVDSEDLDTREWSFYDNLTIVRYQFTPCFGDVNADCIGLPDRTEKAPVIPHVIFPQYKGKSIKGDSGVIVFARAGHEYPVQTPYIHDQDVCFWIATESYLLNDNNKIIEKLSS